MVSGPVKKPKSEFEKIRELAEEVSEGITWPVEAVGVIVDYVNRKVIAFTSDHAWYENGEFLVPLLNQPGHFGFSTSLYVYLERPGTYERAQ